MVVYYEHGRVRNTHVPEPVDRKFKVDSRHRWAKPIIIQSVLGMPTEDEKPM